MNREMVIGEWRRAVDSLGAAEVLMQSGYRADCVSRCYYAIFHAARSALFVHDRATSSHAGVRNMFGLHLVQPGEIEREWANSLAEGLDDRLMADYNPHTQFSSEETGSDYDRAKAFLDRIRRYLLEKGLTAEELGAGAAGG